MINFHRAFLVFFLGVLLPLSSAPMADQRVDPLESIDATRVAEIDSESLDDADPFEGLNRLIFQFNEILDFTILNPLAHIYRDATPAIFQTGVHNVLQNIWAPVSMVNSLLQGKPDQALETFGRFLVNTLFGLFGLFDVATELGLEVHNEDFGQTLAVWGFQPGPYIVLPIIGPTNLRDALGRAVDYFIDPYNYMADHHWGESYSYLRWSASVLATRARHIEAIDSLKETSIDYYASIRSLYDQHRQDLIADGQIDAFESGPEDYMEETYFMPSIDPTKTNRPPEA